MADVVKEIERIFKAELGVQDLKTLKSGFESFISGTEEEKAAANAIAANVKDALAAYMDGEISRSDLRFILQNSERGYRALLEAKVLRVKKAALKGFFKLVKVWLLSRI